MSHKRNRTRNEKIDDAIDKVNNIHPSLIPDNIDIWLSDNLHLLK